MRANGGATTRETRMELALEVFETTNAYDGAIADFCQANAILTMKEYLCDYASPKTLVEGEQVIQLELPKVKNEKFRNASVKRLERIAQGERDFRF